jgi:hypothetical protein
MTRIVERTIDYEMRSVSVNDGPFFNFSEGPTWDIEAMAEDERGWLQQIFNKKTLLVMDEINDDGNWTTKTLADYLAERGIRRRRFSS